MRFAITARAVARQREEELAMNEITSRNVQKVTQFRKGGVEALEKAIRQLGVGKQGPADKGAEEQVDSGPNPAEEKAKALAARVDALSMDKNGQRGKSRA